MKHPMPAIAALAFVLFAPTSFAQSGTPPMSEQEQVQREEQELQNRANERAMAHKRVDQPLPFEQLDHKGLGYLSRDDAKENPWLSKHFDRCDADRDERVSRDEYAACTERRR